MSWLSTLLSILSGKHHPPGPFPVPPPVVRHALSVGVFLGDPAADDKVPQAVLSLAALPPQSGIWTAVTDGAGNAGFMGLLPGAYQLSAAAQGFEDSTQPVAVPAGVKIAVSLTRARPAVVGLMTDGGPIFRTLDGEAHRLKGVSSFREPQIFRDGGDLAPRSKAYAGFNTKRAWLYAETGALGTYAFDLSNEWGLIRDYIRATNRDGFRVALTLLTSARPDAQRIVDRAFDELADFWETILIELMNEPDVYDKHTDGLIVPANTKILWATGDYLDPWKMRRGRYGVDHSPRDAEWMRKGGHSAKEFHEGGGPGAPDWPAHHFPIVEDEPERLDKAGYNVRAVLAYYATCGQMAAGATVHPKSGLLGLPPTDEELPCIAAALQGLDAFPADTPLGAYRIIDERGENTLRTYVKGERAMVRIEPKTLIAPEPGWRSLESAGVLWAR